MSVEPGVEHRHASSLLRSRSIEMDTEALNQRSRSNLTLYPAVLHHPLGLENDKRFFPAEMGVGGDP